MTFNVWHGLRGEAKTRLRGEDPGRKAQRFEWQIELLEKLDPDVLLFQEVNPNSRESKRYAEALGYDYIHKVTSCGIHLPPIKIPTNMNEGLAILARPGLGLRRVGKKRLSGNAKCTATFGFQTKESRYVLIGEVEVEGQRILLATTHLSSPPYVSAAFDRELDRLVDEGALDDVQRDEILGELERKRDRNFVEAERVVWQLEKRLLRSRNRGDREPYRHAILAGDFNTEPSTLTITLLEKAGLVNASSGADFLTWDPVKNHANQEIGRPRKPSLPNFEVPEVAELLATFRKVARQIDFIFVSSGLTLVRTEMVMDEERDGIFPSDHFALMSDLRLAAPADSDSSATGSSNGPEDNPYE
jgi:endonuclease/exonuclease/phosphatase family metal-dependent hydrolase